MLIDTHCHLNFKAFKDDAEKIIEKTLKHNIWMISVGSMYLTSLRAIKLAQNYKEGVYAAVALHPIHLKARNIKDELDLNEIEKFEFEEFDYQKYLEMAKNGKVVAIGETGLDYYRIKENINETKNLQKEVFIKHIKLAKELKKPLIIHCREAHNDLYQILELEFKDFQIKEKGNGVIHCFSGNYEQAMKYLDLGFLISFTGIITFSNDYDEIIKKLPLDKIMIETDAPYLTPIPFRGKRNEPIYVKYVAQKIAEIKNLDFKKVAEETTINARLIFNI